MVNKGALQSSYYVYNPCFVDITALWKLKISGGEYKWWSLQFLPESEVELPPFIGVGWVTVILSPSPESGMNGSKNHAQNLICGIV